MDVDSSVWPRSDDAIQAYVWRRREAQACLKRRNKMSHMMSAGRVAARLAVDLCRCPAQIEQ